MQPNPSSPEPQEIRPEVAEALMREVGSQLRQVREERGEHIEDVAEHLRIRAIYLEGIERGDLSMMPGRTYALGFLRTYADYLGFDGDDLIEQIRSIVDDLTEHARLEIKAPMHESRVPKAPVLLLSAAALAGIYVGWSFLQNGVGQSPEMVAEVPADLRSSVMEALPQAPRASEDAEPAGQSSADQEPADLGPVDHNPTAQHADPRAVDDDASLPLAGDVEVAASGVSADSPAETEAPDPMPSATSTEPDRGAAGPAVAGVTPEAGPERAPTSAALAYVEPAAGPAPVPEPEAADQAAAEPVPASGSSRADVVESGAGVETTGAPEEPKAAEVPAPPRSGAEAVIAELQGAGLSGGTGGPRTIHEEVNQDARVILHAKVSSWIQISSPSGNYLRSRTLEEGDIFLVPNRSDLQLWTGNAGGLEVIVDGEPISPLGEEGTVVKNVSLDPAVLRPGASRQG